jgi:adenylate cyclase
MSRLLKLVVVSLLTVTIGLVASFTPMGLDLEENLGLYVLFHLRGVHRAPPDVVVMTMDSAPAESFNPLAGPERWPRSLHARLTDYLVKQGAAVIAFDMVFDKARAGEQDGLFAAALRKAGNVVLCEALKRESVPVTDGSGARAGELSIERLVEPHPQFAQHAVALAPFPLPKVPVQISQYWTFKGGIGDKPTLPVVVFQLYALEVYADFRELLEQVSPAHAAQLPASREEIVASKGVEPLMRKLHDIFEKESWIAERMLQQLRAVETPPTDGNRARLLRACIRMYQQPDSVYLNYYGPPGTLTTVPYGQVLQLQNDPAAGPKPPDLKGKAVFVGLSELSRAEQRDGFYTVFSQANGIDISGVEIAATAFANLLEDRPLQPLAWPTHAALVVLWGALLAAICRVFHALFATAGVLVVSGLYFLVVRHQFSHGAIWMPLMVPLLVQAPVAFLGTLLWKYYDTHKERQHIRRVFGYYLPDPVVDELARSMVDVSTSSQIVHGTCLFTDAAQYTALSEALEPGELSRFMNQYYEAVFHPVKQHGGNVSDVIGDSMLAIWATAQPDAALRTQACRAALDIARAVEQFNLASGTLRLATRIALHSGHLSLGNIGGIDHYEYRPVGDVVNTASRIEGLNKVLGTQILASAEVLEDLDEFLTRELGEFLLAGKSRPIVIHELICPAATADATQTSSCAAFAAALAAYRRRSWEEAAARLRDLLETHGVDGPALFYLKLSESYREEPPGDTWNGMVRLEKK